MSGRGRGGACMAVPVHAALCCAQGMVFSGHCVCVGGGGGRKTLVCGQEQMVPQGPCQLPVPF